MADPELRAAEVLSDVPRWLWDGRSLPVPVEEIADTHFDLNVCDHADIGQVPGAPPLAPGETLSGLLIVDAKQIWVNAVEAQSSPGRRRFTIGHELGHWVMHRTPHGKVFCRAHGVALDEPHEARPDIEEEASLFSGALLFPTALVRMEYLRLEGDLGALCERFGGSRVATERAVFRAVYAPWIRGITDALDCFYWADSDYEAWRETHPRDGFVLNDSLADPGHGLLHRAGCTYLRAPVQGGAPRTRNPKWCTEDADELRRAFPRARACARCGT
jgi:Zn-dependent peptidase ImmA (M78 family)